MHNLDWESQEHAAFYFKEAKYKNGEFYVVMYENPYGYQLTQVCLPNEQTEDDLKEMISGVGYVPKSITTNPSHSKMEISGLDIYTPNTLETFKQILHEIECLPSKKLDDYSNGERISTVYPGLTIYEITHFAIKIPIQRYVSESDIKWDYEYLIYPDFTLNQQALDMINTVYGTNYSIDLEALRGDFTFSREAYDFFRREFFLASVNVKAIANAIKIRDVENSWTTEYYKLYHESRIAKTDTMSTRCMEYKGRWVEIKLSDYVNLLGEKYEYIQDLSFKTDEKNAFIEAHEGDVTYQPCSLYLRGMSKPVENLFDDYTTHEIKRQTARKNLYFLHIGFCPLLVESTIQYLNNVGCSLVVDQIDSLTRGGVQWVQNGEVEQVMYKEHKKRKPKER